MIIFFDNGTNLVLISTEYGDTGRDELAKFSKACNFKKPTIKNQGSPHSEMLEVPSTKLATVLKNGGSQHNGFAVSHAAQRKMDEWKQKMRQKVVMEESNTEEFRNAQRPAQYIKEKVSRIFKENIDGYEDEPIRHNRKDESRYNKVRQEIRQQRRTHSRRNFPDGAASDDDAE